MSEPSVTAVKTLFAHSGNVCFFGPAEAGVADRDGGGACEAKLTDERWKSVNAEIAHIKGGQPRSARYDEKQPDAERQGYHNLMLLCPNHHKLIDRLRPGDFPVERLTAMRARHLDHAASDWCNVAEAEAFAVAAISSGPVPVVLERSAAILGAARIARPAGAHLEISGQGGGQTARPAGAHLDINSYRRVPMQWELVTEGQWVLYDDDGHLGRQVAQAGPYLDQPVATYVVTGPGYEATDHPSLEEARAAAEASL